MGLPEKEPDLPAGSHDWADFADRVKGSSSTGSEQTQRREWLYEDDSNRVWPLGDHDPNTDVTIRAQAFRAVYDGKTIVPCESVDLPLGPVVLVYAPVPAVLAEKEQLNEHEARIREEARRRLAELLKDMPHIPLEAIRTESEF